VVSLQVINQPQLDDFSIPSYDQITTIRLENAGAASRQAMDILDAIPENSRVRLIGFEINVSDSSEIFALLDKLDTMRGLDENGNNVDKAQVSGMIHISSLTGEELYKIQSRYSNIKVIYNELIQYTVRFWNGNTLLQTVTDVPYLSSAEYTGDTPEKPGVTDPTQYQHIGWDPEPAAITDDTDCYAQFKFNGSYARMLVQRALEGDYRNERVAVVGANAISYNTKVNFVEVTFTNATTVDKGAFSNCHYLQKVDLPKATSIGDGAFGACRSLVALILRSNVVCTLANTYAFDQCNHILGTRYGNFNQGMLKDGYIYVPASLVEDYKVATNWSTYADQIRAIEDYPEICGGEV
jgi:hypothetical protein